MKSKTTKHIKSQRDVVLSIKPVYSEKIITGQKTVELRRRFPLSASSGTLAYIYASAPVKAMVGMASIRSVLNLIMRPPPQSRKSGQSLKVQHLYISLVLICIFKA